MISLPILQSPIKRHLLLRTSINQSFKRLVTFGAIGLLSFSLIACNSSSDPDGTTPPSETNNDASNSSTVKGTAAIGAAIANTPVIASCQGGKGFEQAVTTDAQGRYTGVILKANFPCGFRITHNDTQETYYSYAPDSDQVTVNLTPLTTLLLARATGQSPADWYNQAQNNSGNGLQIRPDLFTQALEDIKKELQSQASGNPITTLFEIGDAYDQLLDHLAETLQANQMSFDELLQGYRDGNSLNAMGVNFETIVIDDSIINDDVPTGNYTLTITTSVMGSATSVVLHNKPKPANESEFCSIQSTELAEQGYKVNSCSFDGQEGEMDLTLSESGMQLDYQIHYKFTPA